MTRITHIQWKVLLVVNRIHSVKYFPFLSVTFFLFVSLFSLSTSLHLLLDLVGVHVNSWGHLHRLAAASADILEEAEVGTARHYDCDDDDNGGTKGWRHSVFQDRLEASHADPTRPPA